MTQKKKTGENRNKNQKRGSKIVNGEHNGREREREREKGGV